MRPAHIATNRFGLGARPGELARAAVDPEQWLLAQMQPLLLSQDHESALALAKHEAFRLQRREQQDDALATTRKAMNAWANARTAETLTNSITTPLPLQARLLDFFSNHFSVTGAGTMMRLLAPTLEREAIGPNLVGPFADLLLAVERHPAMLIYLNNDQSIGPDSPVGKKRTSRGINENLAREILELHTLGVDAGYRQQDVQELAMAITGWTVRKRSPVKPGKPAGDQPLGALFNPKTHQPGPRKVLGTSYPQPDASQGEAILRDLAMHPATAAHLSFKLARHFISDTPDPALVAAMQRTWLASNGDIANVMAVLIRHPGSWQPAAEKFKTPREYVISAFRACDPPNRLYPKLIGSLHAFGQGPFAAGSPAGYSDTATGWNGAESLMLTVEWAQQLSSRLKREPVQLARAALGDGLSPATAALVQRAESRQQATTLLLLSPEFLYR